MGVERLYNSVEFDERVRVEDRTELQAVELETRCGRESHTRPKGPGALMSWGPDKMLIRCNNESHHPAEWAPGLRLSSPGERERHNADGHNFGVKIFQLCSVSSSLSHANLEQPFRTLAIKWEVNIFVKEVFLRLPSSVVYYCVWLIYCVSMYPAWTCICV